MKIYFCSQDVVEVLNCWKLVSYCVELMNLITSTSDLQLTASLQEPSCRSHSSSILTQAVKQSYAVGSSPRENLFLLSRRRGGSELLEAGVLLCRTHESYFGLRSGRSHQQPLVHAQGLISGETAAFRSLSALSGFCELSSR